MSPAPITTKSLFFGSSAVERKFCSGASFSQNDSVESFTGKGGGPDPPVATAAITVASSDFMGNLRFAQKARRGQAPLAQPSAAWASPHASTAAQ